MLQLPSTIRTSRHFTQAEIADITRNAKAVKARRHKPDLLIKRIAAVKKAVERDDAASEASLLSSGSSPRKELSPALGSIAPKQGR